MATALALGCSTAFASVVVSGTRVVYPAAESEVAVKLTNEGDSPALVQAWIDDGNAAALPEDSKAPFLLAPPLFRLDPKKGQTLRIVYLQEPLPSNRESLFWLNVLEVPPLPEASAEPHNMLQFAFRSRLKLLFRPAGLPGNAGAAPGKVAWRFVQKDNGRHVLAAQNPTPYYVTFTKVSALAQGKTYRNDKGGMVAPGQTIDFDIGDGPAPAGEPDEVHFTTVNDFGTGTEGFHKATSAQSKTE